MTVEVRAICSLDKALSELYSRIFLDHMAGLKSIGKAGKAVTKQLGKTLTSLGESPDKLGLQKVQQSRDNNSVVTRAAQSVVTSNPLGLDTGTN